MVGSIPDRPLGKQGLRASAQGLGIMSFGNSYGDTKHVPTEAENQKVLQRATELGIDFVDTADVYGNGVSEQQLGIYLAKNRDKVVVASKFGFIFEPFTDAPMKDVSGKPSFVRQQVEASLERLQTDHIDLYYQHRVDRTVPIEDTWRELKKLVEEGKVKYIGISEATPDELRRAHAIHPVSAIQLEWSLWTRTAEEELIPTARELGVGIVTYSPLGRGFLTGEIADAASLSDNDRRKQMPRFKEGNFKKNVELVAKLKQLAEKKGVTAAQLALAWVHAQGEDVFPIPGTKQVKYLEQNVKAFHVKLDSKEVQYLSDIFNTDAVQGDRYGEAQAKQTFEDNSKKSSSG